MLNKILEGWPTDTDTMMNEHNMPESNYERKHKSMQSLFTRIFLNPSNGKQKILKIIHNWIDQDDMLTLNNVFVKLR